MEFINTTILYGIIPKVKREESLLRPWYTFGYRFSHPDRDLCREDKDCEIDKVCYIGHCTGLHRIYNLHGLYYDQEYKNAVLQNAMGNMRRGIKKNVPQGVDIEETQDYNYNYNYR